MRVWLAAAALLAACSPGAGESASPASQPPAAVHPASGLKVIPLTVSNAGTTHRFSVEVARTGEEQAQGLMFRTQMGADEGMLFPFEPPRQVSFWMKNTVIPLDIIFVGTNGRVSNIAANAEPYSLVPRSSAGPVEAVLELNGGRAEELGIVPGTRVEW
ncbi:hypothetical protein MB02_14615 [Croceicoccus estronivorus]|uniref:DUF192 domain-containing protein n=1 Tax=Croceicoccus estronivorus TaxID=1172626 RepID=UPI000834C46A|nr:DUF192 domain-containing protein [Croceicoccus estronivorus]OCC22990.1 hypothetical protein MB02_14615 [Croceicoccus estronivorus]